MEPLSYITRYLWLPPSFVDQQLNMCSTFLLSLPQISITIFGVRVKFTPANTMLRSSSNWYPPRLLRFSPPRALQIRRPALRAARRTRRSSFLVIIILFLVDQIDQ